MPNPDHSLWLTAAQETVASYRKMIDAALSQLSDDEFRRRPAPDFNSVAILLRHLGGNLRSRWIDFLATDGEKPDRDRDREFEEWRGDRVSLMEYFDDGWRAMTSALAELDSADLSQPISIRGEQHSIPQAVERSLTHVSYHVGQIMLIARLVHQGAWQWLTIAPGESEAHNQSTWGSAASRGVFGRINDASDESK